MSGQSGQSERSRQPRSSQKRTIRFSEYDTLPNANRQSQKLSNKASAAVNPPSQLVPRPFPVPALLSNRFDVVSPLSTASASPVLRPLLPSPSSSPSPSEEVQVSSQPIV